MLFSELTDSKKLSVFKIIYYAAEFNIDITLGPRGPRRCRGAGARAVGGRAVTPVCDGPPRCEGRAGEGRL